MSKTLGQKIKYFRTREGMSQFDLENNIGLAAGVVSRIENDQTNPTKETLLNIARQLKLSPFEIMYIFDINHDDPTQEEISRVREVVRSKMNKPWNFSYLVDNKSRFIEFSLGFKIIGKIANINYKNLLNQHVPEVLFNSELGFRGSIPKEDFKEIAVPVVQFYFAEKSYLLEEEWWSDEIQKLMKFDDFEDIYNEVINSKANNLDITDQVLYMEVLGRKLSFNYQIIHVFEDPRFIIVDYSLHNKGTLEDIIISEKYEEVDKSLV